MNDIFKTIGSPRTLSQEVVRTIEENILNKKLMPGQKLPTEKELGEMFGVSRTALREAMQVLSAKGLVSIRKGSGIYVNNFSELDASKNMSLYLEINFDEDYALHLVELRQIIEPHNARLAALHHTSEDIENLEINLEEYSKANISAERHAQLDLEFHKTIADATGNPLISLLTTPLFNLMPKIKSMIVDKVRHNIIHNALNYHRNIFEEIKAGNENGAYEAMKSHLEVAMEDTRLLIEALKAERLLKS
ncbi:MAG: FadR/GntR family transcriptional regulator [Calditrichia bacterium]|nr:FadR family transcriptional regulator [Calditrichota bacterium]MCB9069048.1 FadR family transcriptional regulator [Calditrichia bacterium]